MSYRNRICNLLSSCLAGKDLPPRKGWFIRINTRVQLIARIHLVYFYLKERGWSPCFSHDTILFPLSPPSPRSTETKCRTRAKSESRKKGLTEPGSLTNTNRIEKNCLFCILSPVPLLPRALRNRSDHIDIPSTQHRSSKGSRTIHQSTKARIRKLIPISRVHNRMDKLTLTRQFWIQLGIFFGGYRAGIGM